MNYNGETIANVVPASISTDNAVVRFDGVTGALIQNSTVIVDDAGALTAKRFQSIDTTNVFVGDSSTGEVSTADCKNTAVGGEALKLVTSSGGNHNSAHGYKAGEFLTTGYYNTFLGFGLILDKPH